MADLIAYYSSTTHIRDLTEGLNIDEVVRTGIAYDRYYGLIMYVQFVLC